MEKALEQTNKLYEDLKGTVDQINAKHNDALHRICVLEEQLEQVHRNQLATTLEISNLPKTDNENLRDVMNKIHTSLGLSNKNEDICRIYRINANKRKPLIVQYKNTDSRNDVIKAVRKYNKNISPKRFNAKVVNPNWDEEPLFFDESLTPNARKLYFLARNLQKNAGFKYCWISSGRVFIRKIDDSPAIVIKSTEEIDKLSTDASYRKD